MTARSVDVPARLDIWMASALDRLLRRPSDAGLVAALRDPPSEGDAAQLLSGVWLVLTAVLGVVGLVVVLRTDDDLVPGIVFAGLAAVPGGMALLRGVVDGVSLQGRLPKRSKSGITLLVCCSVAALGLFFALAR